jgi:OOP family OmpA-OmpF porin
MFIPLGFGMKARLSNSVNLDMGYTTAFVDASNAEGYMKAPFFGSKFSYAHLGLEFSLGNKNKPQLASHNPAAQLYKKMTDNDYMIRALMAAGEVNTQNNASEIKRLKDEHAKMKMDTDHDGVSDLFDKCPGTLNGVKVDGSGCALPLMTKDTITKVYNNTTYIISDEDKKIAKDAVSNLEFEFGKSIIREKSLPYLSKVANLLMKKNISLKLGGHTDNVGSETANMNLSKDRAEAVKKYLVGQGANSSLIEAVGYGETQPIATNKTAVGRQVNRRVEFTLY